MANTATITPIDPAAGADRLPSARRRSSPPVPKTAMILSFALGLAALGLAAPRVPAEWSLLQASSYAGRAVPPELIETLSADGATGGSARAAAAAARLRLATLSASTGGGEERAMLAAAAADLRHALIGAPLNAETWERLAFVEHVRHRPLEAARAWRMAVISSPFDPLATPRRMQSGFALWPFMDADARAAMDMQIQVFYAWGPGATTEMAARFGTAAIVRRALASNPAAAADFERRMAQTGS